MSIYIGDNGVARKIKAIYIGVNGVARKVVKGYIGVNGTARLFYQSDYNIILQHGTVSTSYGTVNSYSRTYVDDHWELYLNATITKSSTSYPVFNEIKITSNSQSLVGKTITVDYKLEKYESSGLVGRISALDSNTIWLNDTTLSSTTRTTASFTCPSNTDHIVVTNHIYKKGTYSNTLYIYSIKINGVKIV